MVAAPLVKTVSNSNSTGLILEIKRYSQSVKGHAQILQQLFNTKLICARLVKNNLDFEMERVFGGPRRICSDLSSILT